MIRNPDINTHLKNRLAYAEFMKVLGRKENLRMISLRAISREISLEFLNRRKHFTQNENLLSSVKSQTWIICEASNYLFFFLLVI